MSTTATPNPGNRLRGMYYTDREYARELGDPLCAVVKAQTKQASEETASKPGFESRRAHPVTAEQARCRLWLPRRKRHIHHLRASNHTRYPHLTMPTPSTAQIRIAIEVLRNLGEHLNEHAAHSIMQLPQTRLGDNYAARIEARTIQQLTHIENVASQLKNWSDEMLQHRKEYGSYRI